MIDDRLARAVETTTNMPGRTGWPTARLLAAHLLPHLDRSTQRDFTTVVRTLDDLADVLSDAGAASEELLLRRHVLDAETLLLGLDHPGTLSSRNNLAAARVRLAQVGRRRWWGRPAARR
ncbi:hypothetical protein AB0E82_14905 [Streptomyces anulatus]|uniref:hypothetical protein n=1 Tax=Streptomyces anulatus TaxID=1892 RepID=UPI0033CF9952